MKRIFIFLSAAAAMASCQNDGDSNKPSTNRITIDPVITRATEVSFEDGDKIGVTITKQDAGTAYATNQLMTCGSGVFSGSLNWYPEGNDKSTITAYYPYSASGVPATFGVAADQSSGTGYAQSDLIASRKTDVLPSANSVSMVFRHMLTKMVVNVTNESGSDILSVVLKGSIPTATVDFDAMTATATGTATATDIKAQQVTANTLYRAIVVPQTVAFTVSVGTSAGKTLSQLLLPATLVQGGQYTVNLRVLADNIEVTLSGDIDNWTDEGEIGADTNVPFEEHEGYFLYDGERYNTVTLSNGRTWMTQPLRYVPEGFTPSSDPLATSGIWFPYSTDGTTCTALTDDASVEALGYLYDYDTALGAEITDQNLASFEGVQGICPKGWHIPTLDEYFDLAGKANGRSDKTDALFYDSAYTGGKMTKAVDAGFNPTFSGTRMQSSFTATPSYQKTITATANCDITEWLGKPSVTYYMTSTSYQATATNIQFWAMGTTFSATYKEGRLSMMYAGIRCGTQVRCVKNL